MNITSLALVIPLVLLAAIVTTPIVVTEDSFARYERHTGNDDPSQVVSISNSCLNPVYNSNNNDNMISNGNCGGTVSQQGRIGQASTPTTIQSANPSIEVQRSTTQSPGLGVPTLSTGNLTIEIICSFCADRSINVTIDITDGVGQLYKVSFGEIGLQQNQTITINPGDFTVSQEPVAGLTTPLFSGGCFGDGTGEADGRISVGQSVICTITEAENK